MQACHTLPQKVVPYHLTHRVPRFFHRGLRQKKADQSSHHQLQQHLHVQQYQYILHYFRNYHNPYIHLHFSLAVPLVYKFQVLFPKRLQVQFQKAFYLVAHRVLNQFVPSYKYHQSYLVSVFQPAQISLPYSQLISFLLILYTCMYINFSIF